MNNIFFDNVTVCGDTRFDRVYEITKQDNSLPFVEKFCKDKSILVAGSTWEKDEELLISYINKFATENEKFIIAPHNIKNIDLLKKSINKEVTLFSEKEKNSKAQVYIVDTIGILTKIYKYANIAYVGGGFGSGIHNILEPATFGVPVIIGPNYNKFKEAIDLVEKKGCFVVHDGKELKSILTTLNEDKMAINQASNNAKKYVLENLGASQCIVSYIKKNSSILQN